MDEQMAREILGKAITADGGIQSLSGYISWELGDEDVTLDGVFTPDPSCQVV